jgi:hypothetical protein
MFIKHIKNQHIKIVNQKKENNNLSLYLRGFKSQPSLIFINFKIIIQFFIKLFYIKI